MVGVTLFPTVGTTTKIQPSSETRTNSSRHEKTLHLPQWLHRVVWMAVLLVCFINAMLALVFAVVYIGGLVVQDGFMIDRAGLLAREYIPVVIGAYVVVASHFMRVLARAIAASVRLRRLAFWIPKNETGIDVAVQTAPGPPVRLGALRRRQRQLLSLVTIVSRDTPPKMFEFIFLTREIMEVATQSYQAYKCSTLISQPWINTFYVAILAVNCWISPLIHFGAQRDALVRRFLFLWSDVALDFASTLIIPVVIIGSVVVVAFEDNLAQHHGEYAFDAPYSDTFLVDMFKGVQQVCIVSWWDFLSKMLPFMSMGGCLNMIMKMVEPPQQSLPGSSTGSMARLVSVTPISESPRRSKLLLLPNDQQQPRKGPSQSPLLVCVRWIKRLLLSVHVIYVLFFAWGAAIVVFHIQADTVSRTTPLASKIGCKSFSKPWLSTKFSCSVLEINCNRRHIRGSADEIAYALDQIEATSLSSLIVSHCPALVMPRQVQTLRNLLGMEIADSVIVEWSDDAALTASYLPELLLLTLTRVNMSELPRGVQHIDFPPHLADVAISGSNLTTLPSDLHTKWRRVVTLYLERTLIEDVPPTITKMPLYRLSLMGNRIRSLSADILLLTTTNQIAVLSIAMNPIQQLPDTPMMGDARALNTLIMDYTDVETLPLWLLQEGARRVETNSAVIVISAGGSRYCKDGHASTNGAFPPGLEIICRLKREEEFEAFPLSFNMKLRAL